MLVEGTADGVGGTGVRVDTVGAVESTIAPAVACDLTPTVVLTPGVYPNSIAFWKSRLAALALPATLLVSPLTWWK